MKQEPSSVLVVDDDADICSNLRDILTDLGYQVDTAQDGPSALELVRVKPYALALLDLKMPGMDGLTLYREIRALRSETVAIIVTAFASEEAAEQALEAGAWRVLSKPVDLSQLLLMAEEALGQPLVLIVEDDPILCTELWKLLRSRGFRVALAGDAATAARKVGDLPFDVVLIDARLPEADPKAILTLVRKANPSARTVLIGSLEMEEGAAVKGALAEGADAVCLKPFDIPRLLDLVGRLALEGRGNATA
jgi:CheY-like chemotaxis protein